MEYFLEPNEFFVGDNVQFYFCLPEEFTNKEFFIDKIKQNSSMTINAVSIIKMNDKNYIKISFVPWKVGNIGFPSLKEIGINSELPYIHVSSILELDKTASLQEARPPLLLPGTTYLIYAYAFSFFIMCILIAGLGTWIKKKKNVIIARISQKYAMLIFYFTVKNLKAKLKNKAISFEIRKSWTKKYEIAFRLFLSSIYKNKDNWDSFTYNEILDVIEESNDEILNLIKSVFEYLSLARFANICSDKFEKKIIEHSFQLLKLYRISLKKQEKDK